MAFRGGGGGGGEATHAGLPDVTPDQHHVGWLQANHDALPNPHHSNVNDHAAAHSHGSHSGIGSGDHHAAFVQADHDALPNPHHAAHAAFVQADHDGLPNPHHSNVNDHAASHSIIGGNHSGFPGGGTTFLRDDGTFAAPPGGGPAFPVGSVFIAVVATNPATLLGYGTWTAFGTGRMLVGIDAGQTEFDVVEETGGAKTHTLVTAEMPAHSHITRRYPTSTGALTGFTADTSMSGVEQNNTLTTVAEGGGGAHNNLPPYIVVYMWKRTS